MKTDLKKFMPKNKDHTDFAPHDVRDWEKVAQQELGKTSPLDILTKKKSGLLIKPYYHTRSSEENMISILQTTYRKDCCAMVQRTKNFR